MGTPKLATPRLHVVMDDGAVYDIQALNVDLVAWDRHRARHGEPLPSDAPFVWLNFLSWHVLVKREGIIPGLTLRQFEERAVEVSSGDADDDDGESDAVGPTRKEVEPE